MTLRRRYHLLVYLPGQKNPDLFAKSPLIWYPTIETARQEAREFACNYDHGVRVDILSDNHVVEQVRSCAD